MAEVAIEEIEISERLAKLSGFDRVMLRYGRLLVATGGATIKAFSKGGTVTSIDVALSYLKKIGAHDFESGKRAKQVADATAYKKASISKALNDLVKRGLAKSEKRGRHIHYWVPTSR